MKRLWIVGAGGLGREIAAWVLNHPDAGRVWDFAGFLDDKPSLPPSMKGETVKPIQGFQPTKNDVFVCAIATPSVKRAVVEKLNAAGANFITIVHPTAITGPRVRLGVGVVISPFSVVTCDAQIGDYAFLNLHCAVGHDARIGAYSTLMSYAEVTGGAELGEGVMMGTHSSVLPGKKVGECAIVGAGSVATMSVEARTTVMGTPAKPLVSHD